MDDIARVYYTVEQIIKSFSCEIRKVRKEKKISQEKLSKLSNVSLGSIKRFERTGNISFISLTQICEALDIKLSIINNSKPTSRKLYE